MSISENKVQHSTNQTPLAKQFYGGFETREHSAGSAGPFDGQTLMMPSRSSHSNGQNRSPDGQHELHTSHSAVCSHCWRPWVDQPAETDGLQGGLLARPELAGDAQCCYRVPVAARQGSLWLVSSPPGHNTLALHWIIIMPFELKASPLSFLHRFAVLCWSWVWKLWKQFHGSHWCSCLLHFRALRMCAEYIDKDAGEADRTQYISAGHVQEKVSGISHVCDGQS